MHQKGETFTKSKFPAFQNFQVRSSFLISLQQCRPPRDQIWCCSKLLVIVLQLQITGYHITPATHSHQCFYEDSRLTGMVLNTLFTENLLVKHNLWMCPLLISFIQCTMRLSPIPQVKVSIRDLSQSFTTASR